MRLAGRTALITGASKGFGKFLAEAFEAEGATVYDTSCLRVGDGRWVEAFMHGRFFSKHGLDIVINNAAVFGPMGPLEGQPSTAEWLNTLNTNLMGPVNVCHAAIRLLRKSERGKIINIVGGGGRALACMSAYSASKAGLANFTAALARELDGNIDVFSVAPGPMDTRFVDQAIAAGPGALGEDLHEEIMAIRREKPSMDRAADLCIWLASRASDGIRVRDFYARKWKGRM